MTACDSLQQRRPHSPRVTIIIKAITIQTLVMVSNGHWGGPGQRAFCVQAGPAPAPPG